MTENATTEIEQAQKFNLTFISGWGSKETSMERFVEHTIKYEIETEQIFEWFDQYPFFEIRRACIARLLEIEGNCWEESVHSTETKEKIKEFTNAQIELFLWRNTDELDNIISDRKWFESLSEKKQEDWKRRNLKADEDIEILRALFELTLKLDNTHLTQISLINLLKRENDRPVNDKMKTKEFYKLLFKNGKFKDNYTPKLKEFILEELERLEPKAKQVSHAYGANLWPVYLLTRIYKFIQIIGDVEILPEIKKYIHEIKINEETLRLSTYGDSKYVEPWLELYGLRLTVHDLLEARVKIRRQIERQAKEAQRKLNQI